MFHYKDLVGDIDRRKRIFQMWLDTKIAKGVMVLQFSVRSLLSLSYEMAGNFISQYSVRQYIAEDIRQLNDCNFGRKFSATTQSCQSYLFLSWNMLHIWDVHQ